MRKTSPIVFEEKLKNDLIFEMRQLQQKCQDMPFAIINQSSCTFTFLKIADKNLSKICFGLAFTCTSASDDDIRELSRRDGSGSTHGRFELNPLFGISSSDAQELHEDHVDCQRRRPARQP